MALATTMALFGTGPAWILGLPAHARPRALGWRRWPADALAGMPAGSAFVFLTFSRGREAAAGSQAATAIAFGALPGLGAALGFWAALRPDRGRA